MTIHLQHARQYWRDTCGATIHVSIVIALRGYVAGSLYKALSLCEFLQHLFLGYLFFNQNVHDKKATYLYVIATQMRLSSVVVCLHPTQPVEIFCNVSTPSCTILSADLRAKFYGDHRKRSLPSGLNERRVAKYSEVGHDENYISESNTAQNTASGND